MPVRINSRWIEKMTRAFEEDTPIDETIGFTKAAQWLIAQLSNRNIPFVTYNLGAGVRRITTRTNVCPCCRQIIPSELQPSPKGT